MLLCVHGNSHEVLDDVKIRTSRFDNLLHITSMYDAITHESALKVNRVTRTHLLTVCGSVSLLTHCV